MTILLATNMPLVKKTWRSCCSWKIFTTKKNSVSSTYFRITNIFRYSTDEWKRSLNCIKTPQYFLSYCVTKTTVYSLSKPSCVRETPWCKVYRPLWKCKCMLEFHFWNFPIFIWRKRKENIKFSKLYHYLMWWINWQ